MSGFFVAGGIVILNLLFGYALTISKSLLIRIGLCLYPVSVGHVTNLNVLDNLVILFFQALCCGVCSLSQLILSNG